ncbi:MAG: MBL fold metallo-hydrolase, partial [Myxococcales bacterium]|nr:MBL fold metallo-hydrolase [Myxococcales bacterium]
RHRALQALVACPTASIGTLERHDLAPVLASFPEPIEGGVHYCGYHHEGSFGAASYLVVRERGNILVDSPRFARPLVRRIEALGGVRTMFLTHVDDVADHAKWAAHFGCERVMHADDARGTLRGLERLIEGDEVVSLDDEARIIPTPGHTRGSACLLYRNRYLFSGDHVAWSGRRGRVVAFDGACWFDWRVQTRSMERLADFTFAWILPGHGRRFHAEAPAMREAIEACARWMRSVDMIRS